MQFSIACLCLFIVYLCLFPFALFIFGGLCSLDDQADILTPCLSISPTLAPSCSLSLADYYVFCMQSAVPTAGNDKQRNRQTAHKQGTRHNTEQLHCWIRRKHHTEWEREREYKQAANKECKQRQPQKAFRILIEM